MKIEHVRGIWEEIVPAVRIRKFLKGGRIYTPGGKTAGAEAWSWEDVSGGCDSQEDVREIQKTI